MPSSRLWWRICYLLRLPGFTSWLDGELERHPRRPSPDQYAERHFRGRVAPQERPRPPHERHQKHGWEGSDPEDVYQAHRRAGDAGGVKRQVSQRREEGEEQGGEGVGEDRKSTRLNSSHANISYAVFCLKKKKYI